MICEKCGTTIKTGEQFCSNCGNSVIGYTEQQNNNQPVKKAKKTLLFVGIVAAIVIVTIIIIVSKSGGQTGFKDYHDVISVCCQAINKKDKKKLKMVVYPDLGESWNATEVFDTVDDWYGDFFECEEYLPLTTEIEDYKVYDTLSKTEEVSDYIYRKTGALVDVEEEMIIEMANESGINFDLIKIEGRWYVLQMWL